MDKLAENCDCTLCSNGVKPCSTEPCRKHSYAAGDCYFWGNQVLCSVKAPHGPYYSELYGVVEKIQYCSLVAHCLVANLPSQPVLYIGTHVIIPPRTPGAQIMSGIVQNIVSHSNNVTSVKILFDFAPTSNGTSYEGAPIYPIPNRHQRYFNGMIIGTVGSPVTTGTATTTYTFKMKSVASLRNKLAQFDTLKIVKNGKTINLTVVDTTKDTITVTSDSSPPVTGDWLITTGDTFQTLVGYMTKPSVAVTGPKFHAEVNVIHPVTDHIITLVATSFESFNVDVNAKVPGCTVLEIDNFDESFYGNIGLFTPLVTSPVTLPTCGTSATYYSGLWNVLLTTVTSGSTIYALICNSLITTSTANGTIFYVPTNVTSMTVSRREKLLQPPGAITMVAYTIQGTTAVSNGYTLVQASTTSGTYTFPPFTPAYTTNVPGIIGFVTSPVTIQSETPFTVQSNTYGLKVGNIVSYQINGNTYNAILETIGSGSITVIPTFYSSTNGTILTFTPLTTVSSLYATYLLGYSDNGNGATIMLDDASVPPADPVTESDNYQNIVTLSVANGTSNPFTPTTPYNYQASIGGTFVANTPIYTTDFFQLNGQLYGTVVPVSPATTPLTYTLTLLSANTTGLSSGDVILLNSAGNFTIPVTITIPSSTNDNTTTSYVCTFSSYVTIPTLPANTVFLWLTSTLLGSVAETCTYLPGNNITIPYQTTGTSISKQNIYLYDYYQNLLSATITASSSNPPTITLDNVTVASAVYNSTSNNATSFIIPQGTPILRPENNYVGLVGLSSAYTNLVTDMQISLIAPLTIIPEVSQQISIPDNDNNLFVLMISSMSYSDGNIVIKFAEVPSATQTSNTSADYGKVRAGLPVWVGDLTSVGNFYGYVTGSTTSSNTYNLDPGSHEGIKAVNYSTPTGLASSSSTGLVVTNDTTTTPNTITFTGTFSDIIPTYTPLFYGPPLYKKTIISTVTNVTYDGTSFSLVYDNDQYYTTGYTAMSSHIRRNNKLKATNSTTDVLIIDPYYNMNVAIVNGVEVSGSLSSSLTFTIIGDILSGPLSGFSEPVNVLDAWEFGILRGSSVNTINPTTTNGVTTISPTFKYPQPLTIPSIVGTYVTVARFAAGNSQFAAQGNTIVDWFTGWQDKGSNSSTYGTIYINRTDLAQEVTVPLNVFNVGATRFSTIKAAVGSTSSTVGSYTPNGINLTITLKNPGYIPPYGNVFCYFEGTDSGNKQSVYNCFYTGPTGDLTSNTTLSVTMQILSIITTPLGSSPTTTDYTGYTTNNPPSNAIGAITIADGTPFYISLDSLANPTSGPQRNINNNLIGFVQDMYINQNATFYYSEGIRKWSIKYYTPSFHNVYLGTRIMIGYGDNMYSGTVTDYDSCNGSPWLFVTFDTDISVVTTCPSGVANYFGTNVCPTHAPYIAGTPIWFIDGSYTNGFTAGYSKISTTSNTVNSVTVSINYSNISGFQFPVFYYDCYNRLQRPGNGYYSSDYTITLNNLVTFRNLHYYTPIYFGAQEKIYDTCTAPASAGTIDGSYGIATDPPPSGAVGFSVIFDNPTKDITLAPGTELYFPIDGNLYTATVALGDNYQVLITSGSVITTYDQGTSKYNIAGLSFKSDSSDAATPIPIVISSGKLVTLLMSQEKADFLGLHLTGAHATGTSGRITLTITYPSDSSYVSLSSGTETLGFGYVVYEDPIPTDTDDDNVYVHMYVGTGYTNYEATSDDYNNMWWNPVYWCCDGYSLTLTFEQDNNTADNTITNFTYVNTNSLTSETPSTPTSSLVSQLPSNFQDDIQNGTSTGCTSTGPLTLNTYTAIDAIVLQVPVEFITDNESYITANITSFSDPVPGDIDPSSSVQVYFASNHPEEYDNLGTGQICYISPDIGAPVFTSAIVPFLPDHDGVNSIPYWEPNLIDTIVEFPVVGWSRTDQGSLSSPSPNNTLVINILGSLNGELPFGGSDLLVMVDDDGNIVTGFPETITRGTNNGALLSYATVVFKNAVFAGLNTRIYKYSSSNGGIGVPQLNPILPTWIDNSQDPYGIYVFQGTTVTPPTVTVTQSASRKEKASNPTSAYQLTYIQKTPVYTKTYVGNAGTTEFPSPAPIDKNSQDNNRTIYSVYDSVYTVTVAGTITKGIFIWTSNSVSATTYQPVYYRLGGASDSGSCNSNTTLNNFLSQNGNGLVTDILQVSGYWAAWPSWLKDTSATAKPGDTLRYADYTNVAGQVSTLGRVPRICFVVHGFNSNIFYSMLRMGDVVSKLKHPYGEPLFDVILGYNWSCGTDGYNIWSNPGYSTPPLDLVGGDFYVELANLRNSVSYITGFTPEVTIIAWSMGGTVARYAVEICPYTGPVKYGPTASSISNASTAAGVSKPQSFAGLTTVVNGTPITPLANRIITLSSTHYGALSGSNQNPNPTYFGNLLITHDCSRSTWSVSTEEHNEYFEPALKTLFGDPDNTDLNKCFTCSNSTGASLTFPKTPVWTTRFTTPPKYYFIAGAGLQNSYTSPNRFLVDSGSTLNIYQNANTIGYYLTGIASGSVTSSHNRGVDYIQNTIGTNGSNIINRSYPPITRSMSPYNFTPANYQAAYQGLWDGLVQTASGLGYHQNHYFALPIADYLPTNVVSSGPDAVALIPNVPDGYIQTQDGTYFPWNDNIANMISQSTQPNGLQYNGADYIQRYVCNATHSLMAGGSGLPVAPNVIATLNYIASNWLNDF